MLFLFKGTPSTSPFCTWVNDPREPEELPADWTPDEPASQPCPTIRPSKKRSIRRRSRALGSTPCRHPHSRRLSAGRSLWLPPAWPSPRCRRATSTIRHRRGESASGDRRRVRASPRRPGHLDRRRRHRVHRTRRHHRDEPDQRPPAGGDQRAGRRRPRPQGHQHHRGHPAAAVRQFRAQRHRHHHRLPRHQRDRGQDPPDRRRVATCWP